MYGTMSEELRAVLSGQLASMPISSTASAEQVLSAKRNRVRAVLLLAVASSDFLIQR